MNKKNLEKVLVTVGNIALFALFWKAFCTCIPALDTLPVSLGMITAGGVLGFLNSEKVINSIENIKLEIKEAFELKDENDLYDEDEDSDEYEEELIEIKEDSSQEEIAHYFQGAFYFQDEYYEDIIHWYSDLGTFKQAREIYCSAKQEEVSYLEKISWDIDFFKEALITIVDVCSDRINDSTECDADVASIINNMAYDMVYDAGYYTIVNGMEIVDKKNIITSIYKSEDRYSFDERKEIVSRLCSITGIVNPLTNKHVALDEGNENGKGKIIQFGK